MILTNNDREKKERDRERQKEREPGEQQIIRAQKCQIVFILLMGLNR